MEETEKKVEIEYVAPVVEFDNLKSVITNIGFEKGSKVKYQIVFPIPSDDEEAKARYDCNLAYLVEAGIRQLTTRVDYKTVGFDADGTLKSEGHEAMQTLADGYTIGRKADPVKAADKAKVIEAKKLESEFGDLKELAAKLAALKAQGLL